MGRQIKFRAWNIENKELKTIHLGEDWTIFFDNDAIWGDKKDWLFEQFTGIKDCNGREIYEGDIVDGSLYHKGKCLPTMGTVEYCNEFAAFCLKNEGWQTLFHNHIISSFKVIGNIHEKI